MTEAMMTFVQRIRAGIYLSLFIAITFLALQPYLHASPCQCETSDSNGESSEFWPADMVPHPHPPGSGPSGPGEPERA